ncbi:MAG: ABC transporter ATP-binding protein [Treponema sp.]|jgi:oligopeptide/dipeptide ABC transporter ATP-binding protein|nr:ABC transporter ATP-binding protein [Treponema sp.]
MLEVTGLEKHFYLSGRRQIYAVNGVSFSVAENETLGIVGESGCGKSTLGRAVLRLAEPDKGSVFFNGEDVTRLDRRSMRSRRRDMQMVFQNPFASFNPKIRIEGALTEVCRYYGMSASRGREKIARIFADTGLPEDLLLRWPRELSGGQLQRLAIARALLSEPSLIVADEPLSALDVSVQAQLLNLLNSLRKSRSIVMIFISHDMTVVEYFCDRVAVMYAGIIMELLPSEELSNAPLNTLHPYTRSLKASAPRIDVFKDSPVEVNAPSMLKGEAPNPLAPLTGCPFAPRCPEAKPRCTAELPEYREVSLGHWLRCFRHA